MHTDNVMHSTAAFDSAVVEYSRSCQLIVNMLSLIVQRATFCLLNQSVGNGSNCELFTVTNRFSKSCQNRHENLSLDSFSCQNPAESQEKHEMESDTLPNPSFATVRSRFEKNKRGVDKRGEGMTWD